MDGRVVLADGLNLIAGANGQGKTNLLEAVYFLGMGRSFRAPRVDRLVRRGERSFRVEAEVECSGVRHEISVAVSRGQRQRALDGKVALLEHTLEVFSCLVFASPRLELFRGTPNDRRRFIDRGVGALRPELIPTYREHSRALRQKNELLRRGRDQGSSGRHREQVMAFNASLARIGARIKHARSTYIDRLQATLDEGGELVDLVPGGVPSLKYKPSPVLDVPPSGGVGATEEALRAALDARFDEESRRGHTIIGAQRDTLAVHQQGVEMSVYGSSGQQRATLITLKVCKMLVHKKLTGHYPLLLVDDVDSELDAERTQRALGVLEGPFQAILASARGSEWAHERQNAHLQTVENGMITAAKTRASDLP